MEHDYALPSAAVCVGKDSSRKRKRTGLPNDPRRLWDKQRERSRINIGVALSRWRELRDKLQLDRDAALAWVLLDSFEKMVIKEEKDEMFCKSVGTDLSMLDIDDFITEISQLKKKVALLETKLRLRGDEGLMREDVDVVCCESSTQDSELSLTLLCYTESKHTDAQDTTVCDSNQDLQDDESTDQTSTESLDSVCNAGEQQQILQTKLNMCSVKLIDCTNLMMKIKTDPTEIKTEPTPDEYEEDKHNDGHDFILTDVRSELCVDGELTSSILSCITGGEALSSERHLKRKRTEEKLFTRSRSEISFTTLQEKKLHSEVHRENKKRKKLHFHCQQCGKDLFATTFNINVHMRQHSKGKPFYCTECGHYFSTKQNLDVHQRIHTGEKPYECPHCEKRFRYKPHLKRHMRLHTNERPYQCSQCGKTFTRSSYLKAHQKVHRETLSMFTL